MVGAGDGIVAGVTTGFSALGPREGMSVVKDTAFSAETFGWGKTGAGGISRRGSTGSIQFLRALPRNRKAVELD